MVNPLFLYIYFKTKFVFICCFWYNQAGGIMKKVELLSPAGDMNSLHKAVENGADAVYLGGKKFGARKFASNFDNEEMIEAIRYCHLYGVKIYVTVNTIIYENELKEVLTYIQFLHQNNVDAIIVQDLGLIRIVRKIFPNLEIHASTQCHNNSEETVRALSKLGVKRVVLARELSLNEIEKINVDIEKEIFVHGALCVSYSGCCLFSSMNGGRSGNRGECVGSCRLPYKLLKDGIPVVQDGNYLLSTKSLCTLENIGRLIEANISAFKIEGRMKSPEYIGYITSLYRKKIDEYYLSHNVSVSNEEINNIKKLYNRELTKGYLFGEYGKSLMNIKTSNHIGIIIGKVLSIDKKKIKILLSCDLNQEDAIRFDNDKGMIVNRLYDEKERLVNSVKSGHIALVDNKIDLKKATIVRKTQDIKLIKSLQEKKERKVKINMNFEAHIGKMLKLVVSARDSAVEEYGGLVEKAQNSPTSIERIKEQLEKLGNTPFISEDTTINADDYIFISIKEVNELRRGALLKLEEKLKNHVPYPFLKNEFPKLSKEPLEKNKSLRINILARNEEQLKAALKENVGFIYVCDYDLYKKYQDNDNVFYRTKRTATFYKDFKNQNILATDLGSAFKYSKENYVVSDYYLNVVNSSSISYLLENNVKMVTLSVENSLENIESLADFASCIEVIIFGRIELMVTKYCPINMLINNDSKKCNLCSENHSYMLEDQYGNTYPVINEKHLTHIMHSKNIDLIDKIKVLKQKGITNYRIELFDENKIEIKEIIKEIKKAYE